MKRVRTKPFASCRTSSLHHDDFTRTSRNPARIPFAPFTYMHGEQKEVLMPIRRSCGLASLVLARALMLWPGRNAMHDCPRPYGKAAGTLVVKHPLGLLAMIALLGVSSVAFGQDGVDPTRSITLKCDYSDYKTFQYEAANLERTVERIGDPATTRFFRRGEEPQSATYIVGPGQVAECVFPSGHRVRAKVGEGAARPYGMCGGDPEVFASVWVNERKIASRVWFAGHCREADDNPDVSFQFTGVGRTLLEKCHTKRTSEEISSEHQATNKSLKVCVDYPDVSRFPRDPLEYPPSGRRTPTAGEIELLSGTHMVCKAALNELRDDFHIFSHSVDQTKKTTFLRPDWREATVELPESMIGGRESIFDFDNDGKLDRVLLRDLEGTYLDGSILLVQLGRSSSALEVPANLLDTASWALPCQLDPEVGRIQDCPGLSPSQRADDAGFWVQAKGRSGSVRFRARYATLAPFTFGGASYVGVSSVSTDSDNYVAILKPLPGKKAAPMCLLRQIEENF